jgi:hypothetical protein
MGSCSSISKGDDKFITTDYLQQCPTGYVRGTGSRKPRQSTRESDMSQFNSLEMCAGQGPGARPEMAGFDHAALVELEPAACATLRLNRPAWNVIEEDLRRFDGRPLPGH